ncbi:MAG: EamA family transporter, partial [Nanoarchaeota archaeon]|nr:EamA family transporter [Nanoarchaeota archaeon]
MEWYILALLSAVVLSVIPIIRKKVLMHEHASEFATTVHVILCLLFLPLLPFLDWGMNSTTFFFMVVKGVILSVAAVLWMRAARHLEVSFVEPLRNLSIIFVLVFSFVFLGEIISLKHALGILLLVVGAYVLEVHLHKVTYAAPKSKYLWFIFWNIIIVSLTAVMDKFLVTRTDPLSIIIFPAFMIAIILFLYQSLKYDGLQDVLAALKKGRWAIFFVALLVAITDLLYILAVAVPGSLITLVVALRK